MYLDGCHKGSNHTTKLNKNASMGKSLKFSHSKFATKQWVFSVLQSSCSVPNNILPYLNSAMSESIHYRKLNEVPCTLWYGTISITTYLYHNERHWDPKLRNLSSMKIGLQCIQNWAGTVLDGGLKLNI